jgi:hypothetical protein
MAKTAWITTILTENIKPKKIAPFLIKAAENMLPSYRNDTIKYNIVLFKKRGALTP